MAPSNIPIKPPTVDYGKLNDESHLTFLIVAGALNTPNKLDIFPVALEEDAENESLTVRFTIV